MKEFFIRRTTRERVLLLVFVLGALAWWAPAALGRIAALRRDWHSASIEQETQRLWLERREQITTRASGAAKILDPAKTLDAARAFAELSRAAAGLGAEIAGQRTDRTEQFALHSMQVTIRRTELAGLLKFYEQLSALAPYLVIEQCSLSTTRANPGKLDASFRIYAIEMPLTQ
jgi:hypothetical protein